jgi:hypothetical protein
MPVQERQAVLQDLAGTPVVVRLVEAVAPRRMDEPLESTAATTKRRTDAVSPGISSRPATARKIGGS